MIAVLAEARLRVIAPDNIGYGRSDKDRDSNFDISNGADDLAAACDYICQTRGTDKVHMYGISSGALRAGLFAQRNPDRVDRLVLDAMVWTGAGSPTLENRRKKLLEFKANNRRPIDLEMAQETLKDLIDDRGRSVAVEAIVKRVASHFGIKMAELKSRNNARHIVFPRQVAMFLCKRLTDKSLPGIGTHFDKHHTTVIHAIRKVESLRARDREIDRTLSKLEEELA